MRFVLLLALALPFSASAAPTVKLSGIRIVHETVGEGFKGLIPFNAQKKGTSMALIVESGGSSIIGIDVSDSTIDSFSDDKGTDLLVKKKGFQKDGLGSFPRVTEDGKAGMVEINSSGSPADGATSITAKGTLIVRTGSTTKALKSAPFEAKKGAALTVGDIDLKVNEVGKPNFGDDAVEIEFQTDNKAIQNLAGVSFFGADGKELESDSSGSSSMGFANKMTYGRSFSLKKPLAGKLVLQFEVWTDLEETKLPIDVTAGVGG